MNFRGSSQPFSDEMDKTSSNAMAVLLLLRLLQCSPTGGVKEHFTSRKIFKSELLKKLRRQRRPMAGTFIQLVLEAHMSNKHQSQSWERIAHKLRCRDLEIWIPPTAAKKLHKMRFFHLPSRWPIGSKEHIAIYSNFALL